MRSKLLLIITFYFLFSNLSLAQKKTFVPVKGEIVFSSTAIIPDTSYFLASLKENNRRLVDYLVKKLDIANDEKVDTASLLTLMSGSISPKSFSENFDYHFLYQDSLIESYKTLNSKRSNSFSIINTKQLNYTDLMVFDDDTSGTDPVNFQYLKLKDKNIKEFKSEKRVINGYECFKVVVKYKIDFGEEDDSLEKIIGNEQCIAVYWVTDKIQSLFHPVSKEKEILENYYPLEITYDNPLHKGLSLVYRLRSTSLSD